jgi:hypothetical protein
MHAHAHMCRRFTGTAGTAVVTTDKALLWTDGRYFLQAVQELGPEWTLMRAGTPGCPDVSATETAPGRMNPYILSPHATHL